MAEQDNEGADQLDILRWLPAEKSAERINALWRQMMVYRAFAGTDLSEAKARREQAELTKVEAEQEVAKLTQMLSQRTRAEVETELQAARNINSEAARARQEAEAKLNRAREIKKQAESSRERILAEARQKAQEIMKQARQAAQQECTELRLQAINEIKAMLVRVEAVQATADEELETQRIMSSVAKLKASSASLLSQTSFENGPTDESAEAVHELQLPLTAAEPAQATGQAREAGADHTNGKPGGDSTDGAPTSQATSKPTGENGKRKSKKAGGKR